MTRRAASAARRFSSSQRILMGVKPDVRGGGAHSFLAHRVQPPRISRHYRFDLFGPGAKRSQPWDDVVVDVGIAPPTEFLVTRRRQTLIRPAARMRQGAAPVVFSCLSRADTCRCFFVKERVFLFFCLRLVCQYRAPLRG